MGLSTRFKNEAEQIAEDIRGELGLQNIESLDPHALLRNLELPAISLADLVRLNGGKDPELANAVGLLHSEETSSLSAATVFCGPQRMVVYNESHAEARQNSDLCHEAAHALLLHPPAPALDTFGCRAWNREIEDEAQFLAGTLLIPGKGVRYAAKAGWSLEVVADRFGCSVEMARWRDNVAGGRRMRRRQAGL